MSAAVPALADMPDAPAYTAIYVVLNRHGNVTIVVSTRARADALAAKYGEGHRVEQWIVFP